MGGPSPLGTVWLDLTRTLGRIGRSVGTEIDRVELAYLDYVLDHCGSDSRFLAKTTRGFLLLDKDGATVLRNLARHDGDLPRADLVSRLSGRGHRPRHQAEAALRAIAIDRAVPWGLGALIRRNLKPGTPVFLVGHSNLSHRVLSALDAAQARIVVMVHDLIPITHPETVVPDMPARFAARIETVRTHADLILTNSEDTKIALTTHWADTPDSPRQVVAHLGVDPAPRRAVPRDPLRFVMVGTIEPRKNHALMLEAWEHLRWMRDDLPMPTLHILGPRGWHDEAFFRHFDSHPLLGSAIVEHGPVSDEVLHDHVAASAALLFPSLAEGFGFPPMEALAHGTLPIVSDLPVLRELLGASAVYLPPSDAYLWAETIKKCIDGNLEVPDLTKAPLPTWRDHFETVERAAAG